MIEEGITYINASRILTLSGSGILMLGLYHQVYKIFQTRSAKDFTLSLIMALLFSELTWINYGIAINEWPIVLIAGANLPAVIMASIGYYRYGRNLTCG